MTALRGFLCALFALLFFLPWTHAQQAQPDARYVQLTYTTIDVPGAGFSYVTGINSAGHMVGTYGLKNNGFYGHGFFFKDGAFSYFDFPNASVTYTGHLNDFDVVVGSFGLYSVVAHGFIYDGHSFSTVDFPPGRFETAALGINNAGEVVGAYGSFAGLVFAFEMKDGRYKKIRVPSPREEFGEALSINNSGQIAAIDADGIDSYGFLYRNGTFKPVVFPGAEKSTLVADINDHGFAVGSFWLGYYKGFAYKDGQFVWFTVPDAMQTYVAGINNSGQIVGEYVLYDYSEHGFVSSPITDADFK